MRRAFGEAYKIIAAPRNSEHLDAGKVAGYVLNNHCGLADYSLKAQFSDERLRSLGAAVTARQRRFRKGFAP